MKYLTHTEALHIVVEAARAYAEIAADRESKAHKKRGGGAEIRQAIETLQSPPVFLPTFGPPSP